MNTSLIITKPCLYVPLSHYEWAIRPLFFKPRGSCYGITLPWNPTVICLFVALHAVAIWMALALNVEAIITFKRRSTLYFWSIIITACGIIIYAVTIDLMFLTTTGKLTVLGDIIYPIAWMMTGTGFLLVLYSRLHLIVDSPRFLRALAIIIFGLGIPLQIIMVLAGDRVLNTKVWLVTIRLEMIFPFSEIFLSILYVYLFIRFMRQSTGPVDKYVQRTFYLLTLVEAFVIVAELIGITLWFSEFYLLRLAVLPFTCALKLKVEFMILNRLTGVGKRTRELRDLTISAARGTDEHGEVELGMEVASPRTLVSSPALMMDEKGLGINVRVTEDAVREKITPSDSISEIPASLEGSGGRTGRESFDEIERMYLGRFGGRDDTV